MTNQLYVGDAHERLRQIGMNSAHCCVTSPPYWGQRRYTEDEAEHGIGSLDQWVGEVATTFDLVRDVLVPDALCWVVIADTAVGSGGAGGDYNDGGSKAGATKWKQGDAGKIPKGSLAGAPFLLEAEMLRRGWLLRSRIVWAKGTPGKPQLSREKAAHVRRPKRAHEYVLMFAQSMDYVFRHDYEGETGADVWYGPSASNDKLDGFAAKAPFPEWLVTKCLMQSMLMQSGETVLDPYAGACTTGKVAERLGLDWIGVDIDEDAVKAAQIRLVDVEVR